MQMMLLLVILDLIKVFNMKTDTSQLFNRPKNTVAVWNFNSCIFLARWEDNYILHIGICNFLSRHMKCVPSLLLNFFNVYFWEKESETHCERGRGRERGRHRIWSRPRLWAVRAWCGAWTHEPWDHDLSQSRMPNRLRHPGAPIIIIEQYFGLSLYMDSIYQCGFFLG